MTEEITFDQFLAVDLRVGRIVAVEDFPEARKPAWKLTIDFGPEVGVKRSSAQITNYSREELEGRLIVAVVNFPPRQIGPVRSEVLTLGASDTEGRVILLAPDADVPLGSRIH
ncbi:tRNA-binding protein [Solirubrobacter ginsenosidimutans]|uniref:tRNA-binding protein n=1 Tax=Solirubrobacter ginsenosidimutans TaxID=490573 RepID=A0A9X3S7C3_9ACTN|nr:tRNA-binding protein [Solirubrobacter ginsenosidimutans]MDA0163393.1 tRNA-binding protein [Solirubrobacter ginsenosidimutans]